MAKPKLDKNLEVVYRLLYIRGELEPFILNSEGQIYLDMLTLQNDIGLLVKKYRNLYVADGGKLDA